MEREVRTTMKAVFGAQFAQEFLYRAKSLLYVINLALTGRVLVRLPHSDHHCYQEAVRAPLGSSRCRAGHHWEAAAVGKEREETGEDELLCRDQHPLPRLPGLLAGARGAACPIRYAAV